LSEGKPAVAFITYTKGAAQYVTSPVYETAFLNWLNKESSSTGWVRETHSRVGVQCCPITVHAETKKNATVLTLVKKEAE
jgi:hypothetical protein